MSKLDDKRPTTTVIRTTTFNKDTVNQRLKGRFSTEETVKMMKNFNPNEEDDDQIIELDDD